LSGGSLVPIDQVDKIIKQADTDGDGEVIWIFFMIIKILVGL